MAQRFTEQLGCSMVALLTFHQYSALSLTLAYVPVRGGRSVDLNT